MCVVPMIEEYLFIKYDFITKRSELSSFPLRRGTAEHLILLLGFLEYGILKNLLMINLIICRQNLFLGVLQPCTHSRNGSDELYLSVVAFRPDVTGELYIQHESK